MRLMYHKLWTLFILATVLQGSYAQVPTATFTADQYKKALWMTTRFYGAQRSGNGPNWLLAEHVPTNVPNALSGNLGAFIKGKSFVKDADGTYDLTGGWFDCGDHVKFGQTEFYSAYMLILGYSEFTAGYDDYYTFDYSDYIAASDYTWEGKKGKPNGIPDILDEVKYATDYFLKCVRDKSTFYYQVGDGTADHNHWVTAPIMSTLSKTEGGEKDGPRLFKKASGNVTSMASLCGATLAVMARVYKPFDPAYAQKCLEKALVAYEFVNTTAKGNTGSDFYPPKGKYEPDLVIFNAELYRTTGEAKYKTGAEASAGFVSDPSSWNHNFSLCYNNTEDLAFYLLATMGHAQAKTRLLYYTDELYKPASGYFLNKKNDTWGVLRFPANQSFVYALKDKLIGETSLNPYAIRSIEYIMGNNGKSFSYIVGFGANHPKYPHHRNFYGEDNDSEKTVKAKDKYMQLGYMTGGSLNDGAYEDLISSYTFSEGGIDYNAGLVGALGYINSIVSPVNVNKFGHPSPDLGASKSLCGTGSATLTATVDLSSLKAGESVTYKWYKGTETTPFAQGDTKTSVTVTAADTYRCDLVEKSGAWTTSASVVVTAVLPTVSLGADAELCSTTSKLLDAGVTGTGISYTWKKNAVAIAGATTSTYTAYTAGTYSVTVSATGCVSQTDEIKITSLLPSVNYDTLCAAGLANLEVTTPGSYQWFDVPTGGTAIASTPTFSANVVANKTYYVQDASSLAGSVGPNPTTYTGGGNGNANGEIEMRFEAVGNYAITNLYIPYILYNAGESAKKASFEIVDDATGTVVSTQATVTGTLVSGSYSAQGTYLIKFAVNLQVTGGTAASPKVLRLRFATTTPANNNNVYVYQDGSGPLAFPYGSGPLKIIGTRANGNLTTNKYPHFVKIDYLAGSSCSRTPVLAIIDPAYANCGGATTVTQTISLAKGWNFIGIGVGLANYSLASIFGANMSKIVTVKDDDGFYSATQPAFLNTLSEMKPGYGYFVYASAAVSFSLTGTALKSVSVPVKAGWNMVSYPYTGTPAIATALSSVWSVTNTLKNFDGYYIKNGTTNNLSTMDFGKGYMLKLTDKGTLAY